MLPDVSVVMGVYNGSNELPSTIRSLQAQSLVNFELIIVDDGSTDDSASVAKSFAATDHRIRLITQDNQGLTAALNNGCRSARARVIARQDVGDVSLPERLSRQFEYLTQHLDVVAISCGANRLGPEHEFLGEERPKSTAKEVTADLLERGTGLLHAASMFRKEPFEASGCYRKQFRFAQDTDLWYRLSECGLLSNTKEVLFEYCIDISGISPQNRARQRRLGQLARECFLLRQSGKSDAALLEEANRVSWDSSNLTTGNPKQGQGAAAYFVGSQLYQQRDQRCRRYLKMALASRARPIRSALKYATSFLNCRDKENKR